jgi:hypothetical protein
MRREFARLALRQRGRHVFLDGDGLAVLVLRQVHDRKAAARYLLYNPVIAELQALGQ